MQDGRIFLLIFTLAGASAQVSEWGLDEGLIMEMQDLFGDPLERALQGLPVLMDYRGPEVNTSSLWVEGTSNDTLELSREVDDALRYYLPSTKSNISEQCSHDVQQIHNAFKALNKSRIWPILMVDSWGKLPDGYLFGNQMPLGMMEECTAITVDDHDNISSPIPMVINATFKGQYCFVVHGNTNPGGLQTHNDTIPDVSGNIPNLFFLGLSTYGTCMPDSCSGEDFKVSLEEILPPDHVVRVVDCHTKGEELHWEPKDYAFIGVMGFIAFLVIAAAAVDLTINYMDVHELRKGPLRYLLVFSGYTNMSKIFHINTKASAATIGCLHGIRVLSMTWVIYCHQHSFAMYGSDNWVNIQNMYDDFLAQTILGATVSVDTFFFLSGLLVAYGLMRGKDKMDLFGFFMFYVHRILRLTPPIAAICFFSATVARFFNWGPMGDQWSKLGLDPCNQNWIYDVLFINNFAEKACLGQTWYTSVDMQMYFLVPLIFFPLMYHEKIGAIWLAFMTLVSFVIPTVLNHVFHISVGILIPQDQAEDFNFFLYGGTWSRMSPYLIGMWTGYIIYKTANKKVTMSKWQVILGWLISVGIGLLVVYGIYPYNNVGKMFEPNRVGTQSIADLYNGFFRGAWGLVMMWLVLACHYGYGGPVNSFLAHPSWQPLSRLTYGMFLVSVTVQTLLLGGQYTLTSMDHLTVIIDTCGTLFLTGIGACILSLLAEGPVLGLEKLIFGRQGKNNNNIPASLGEEKKTQDILKVEAPTEENLNSKIKE